MRLTLEDERLRPGHVAGAQLQVVGGELVHLSLPCRVDNDSRRCADLERFVSVGAGWRVDEVGDCPIGDEVSEAARLTGGLQVVGHALDAVGGLAGQGPHVAAGLLHQVGEEEPALFVVNAGAAGVAPGVELRIRLIEVAAVRPRSGDD